MYGIQWDLVCKFIEKNAGLKYEDIATDSTGYGNYKQLQATGISEESKILNIYDFAGNEWEWTLEKTPDTSAPCVRRGACFDNAGSIRPASGRENETRTIKNGGIAFRSTLY